MTTVAAPNFIKASHTPAPPETSEHHVVVRARGFVPELRKRQAEFNRLARMPDDIEQKFEEAGLYRLMVPREYGGYQGSIIDYMKMVTELGRGDAGIAWAVALVTSCIWTFSMFWPKHVVDEVFADPNARLAGVFGNRGVKARKVEGGIFIEKGIWPFNSGVYQAQWDIFGVPVIDENGEECPMLALFPMSDVTLLHDWDTTGIRASGSTSAKVEGVFVPDERVVDTRKIVMGAQPRNFDDAYSNIAFQPMMVAILAYPVIGAALHMLEVFQETVPGRNIMLTTYADSSLSAVTQYKLSEAASKIEAGQLVHAEVASQIDSWARSGVYMPALLRAKQTRNCAFANRMIWEGVDILANALGGSFARTDNVSNRLWQDVKVGTMHSAISFTSNAENFGRLAFGLDPIMPT